MPPDPQSQKLMVSSCNPAKVCTMPSTVAMILPDLNFADDSALLLLKDTSTIKATQDLLFTHS